MGKPIARELGGGKSHQYSVILRRNEYFLVSVAQLGVDVAVAVIEPDGGRVFESNHPGGALAEERVAWIAKTSGTHFQQVRSVETTSRPGPYTITLENPSNGTINLIRVTPNSAAGQRLTAGT